jgi:hypothetical protein
MPKKVNLIHQKDESLSMQKRVKHKLSTLLNRRSAKTETSDSPEIPETQQR